MYIQLEKQYTITIPKINNITIEFDIESYIKNNDIEINDEEDLRATIQDWIDYDCKELYYDIEDWNNDLISDDYDETNLILNMDALVKELFHLIPSVNNSPCCAIAKSNKYNYCPICGAKLNY